VISSATALFVNAAAADYHLKAGAPALDFGVAGFNGQDAPAADFEGDARPQGEGFDIGYDELATEPPPPSDTSPPTATFSGSNVTVAGGTTQTFAVTYSDNAAVQVGSLDGSDVRVTGPNAFSQLAALVSVSALADGTPRTATYRITAPGGAWDASDNGTYTVSLQAGQVSDTAGNYAAAGTLGTFGVSVPPADTTAPVVTSRSPASGATDVSTATNVSATFNEPVVASGVTFELRDASGALVQATTMYDDTTRTITLDPAAVLNAAMTYTATLSGVKDLSGNAAATTNWSFTTGAADAGTGPNDGFSGSTLGAAWTASPYISNGTVTVADGTVSISGMQVRSSATVTRGVEGRIRFTSRWQAFGIATDLTTASGNSWAMISTKSTPDLLYARTNVNGDTRTVELGPTPTGLHTYRVEPVSGGYAFYIDGTKVATIAQVLPPTAATKLVLSDMIGVAPLVADWVRTDADTSSAGMATSSLLSTDNVAPARPADPATSVLE